MNTNNQNDFSLGSERSYEWLETPIIETEGAIPKGNDKTLWEYHNEPKEKKFYQTLDNLVVTAPISDAVCMDNGPIGCDKMESMESWNDSQAYSQYSPPQEEVMANNFTSDFAADVLPPDLPAHSELLIPLDQSSQPSPTSTINSIRSYEPINNNGNDTRVVRSRRLSFDSGKVVKKRRTQAVMKKMSIKERNDLKKAQNKVNSSNYVARQNGVKAELEELLPMLEDELQQLKMENAAQENDISHAYAIILYDNNAPYGHPDQLRAFIENSQRAAVEPILSNTEQHLADLKNKQYEAKESLDEVNRQDPKKIKPGTLGSQKCREKKKYDTAVLKYQTEFLKRDIMIEKSKWNALAEFAKTLNPYLYYNREKLPEYLVDVHENQFDPS